MFRDISKRIWLLIVVSLTLAISAGGYYLYQNSPRTYSYISDYYRDYPDEVLFTLKYPSMFYINERRRSTDIQTSCNKGFTSGGFPMIGFDIYPSYDKLFTNDFSEYSEKLMNRYPGVSVEYLGKTEINGTTLHHFVETFHNSAGVEGIADEYPGKEYLVLLNDRYLVELEMNYSPYTCISKRYNLRNEREAILNTLNFNQDIF